jgi:hypothetical protein
MSTCGFLRVVALALAAVVALPAADGPRVRDLFAEDFDAMFHGVEKNSAAGFSVATGDINGDGLDDLIIGAAIGDALYSKKKNAAGATFVYFGRKELGKIVDLSAQADLVIYGANGLDMSGFAVASGDLNGDGIDDIIIGAPQADSTMKGKQNDSGITYVVFGRKEFSARKIGLEAGAADVELHSTKNGEYSGSSLAVGDVNGDHIADLLIGAPFTDKPLNDAGVVYVVCGSKALAGKMDLSEKACSSVRGRDRGDRLGLAVAAGDLNGDGMDDLVLGALEADGPGAVANVGQVVVLLGRTELPRQFNLSEDAAFTFWGSTRYEFVGSALAVADVNGDALDDVVIGVPYADLTPGSAGSEEEEEKEAKEPKDAGKTFVFFGRKDFSGQRSSKDGADVVLLGGQGGTNYGDHAGGCVGAGDLDGDGLAEIVVGAPLADVQGAKRGDPEQMKDVGGVFVVAGSKEMPARIELAEASREAIYGAFKNDFFAGVALTKPRQTFGGLLNPDTYRKAWVTRRYDRMFTKAIAMGDINGDGAADLLVGAPASDGPRSAGKKIDDAGVVYLFLGKK